jgi:hypothetical protein
MRGVGLSPVASTEEQSGGPTRSDVGGRAEHVSGGARGACFRRTNWQPGRERDPEAPSAGLRPERDARGLRGVARRGNCACGQWRAMC